MNDRGLIVFNYAGHYHCLGFSPEPESGIGFCECPGGFDVQLSQETGQFGFLGYLANDF
jgi:hypothetical protein